VSLNHRRGAVSAGPAGERILCAWDDCENYGLQLYKVPIQYAKPGSGEDYNVIHLFCCERHMEYWKHSHKDMGNLPPGARGRGRFV
jgi:hypothetical protein